MYMGYRYQLLASLITNDLYRYRHHVVPQIWPTYRMERWHLINVSAKILLSGPIFDELKKKLLMVLVERLKLLQFILSQA